MMKRLSRRTIARFAPALAALCALGSSWSAKTTDASDNVEVIVSGSLYSGGEMATSLSRYVGDLQAQGYRPYVTAGLFPNPAALRSHLASRHGTEGLAGVVLIGDLPVEHFERDGQFGDPEDYDRFPCDLYYMDLDGVWSDGDGNGTYDTHLGNVAPEIWVGRMTTSPLAGLHAGRTEAGLLNDYFRKNHHYRLGRISLPDDGLAYIDDDWSYTANSWGNALGRSVGGSVQIIKAGATTVAGDYKDRLDPNNTSGYESVLLAAHSDATYHVFEIGGERSGGSVYSSELSGLDPQALFYNLFACSNADYQVDGYMAGEYVFGTGRGLLAVGSTKKGGMRNFEDYYEPLGDGKPFGEAFLDWWLARAAGGFQTSETDWYYGMTMIGDPLLMTQEYDFPKVPEPATIALLAAGLACGLLRCRTRLRK